MNQEDIICIAREAGLKVGTNISGVVLVGSPSEIGLAHLTIEEIERFAALIALRVAAAEREACAKVCDERRIRFLESGRPAYEKEAGDCAAAIRARGLA